MSTATLSFDSVYPQAGYVACVVAKEWIDDLERKLARVCTVEPCGIESVAGDTNFTVLREQIVRR